VTTDIAADTSTEGTAGLKRWLVPSARVGVGPRTRSRPVHCFRRRRVPKAVPVGQLTCRDDVLAWATTSPADVGPGEPSWAAVRGTVAETGQTHAAGAHPGQRH